MFFSYRKIPFQRNTYIFFSTQCFKISLRSSSKQLVVRGTVTYPECLWSIWGWYRVAYVPQNTKCGHSQRNFNQSTIKWHLSCIFVELYLQWLFLRGSLDTADSKLTICCLFNVIFSIFKNHSQHNLDFLFVQKSMI